MTRLRGILPPSPAAVLDAGGGTGIFATQLAQQGHHVTLVDVLPEMVTIARDKAIGLALHPHSLQVRQGDLEDLSFLEPESFDLVLCTQVLNFCSDLPAVLQEFYRVLKPGGVLFADIDSAYRWALIEALAGHLDNAIAIVTTGEDVERHIVGARYFFHSPAQLADQIAASGLRMDKVWGVQYVAAYIHVFAQSAEFLNPDQLPTSASVFLDASQLDKLRLLENALSDQLSPEGAAWLQFSCHKEAAT